MQTNDTIDERYTHPGGVVSEVGEVLVGSVSYDDETEYFQIGDMKPTVLINNDTPNASLAYNGTGGNYGSCMLRFIADFSGRAYVMRRDTADTTTLRVQVGQGVL